eukprot:TRINITY_DN12400_c0_g1_i7.p1 TRINITY_DN12400_c0_g1~~TRINITY_DN12400_c0_g1_i7.p1  ORF type:complete len:279 (+),score=26.24 TRINITY_DN12400_c0_g1_i7:665-1501(+)
MMVIRDKFLSKKHALCLFTEEDLSCWVRQITRSKDFFLKQTDNVINLSVSQNEKDVGKRSRLHCLSEDLITASPSQSPGSPRNSLWSRFLGSNRSNRDRSTSPRGRRPRSYSHNSGSMIHSSSPPPWVPLSGSHPISPDINGNERTSSPSIVSNPVTPSPKYGKPSLNPSKLTRSGSTFSKSSVPQSPTSTPTSVISTIDSRSLTPISPPSPMLQSCPTVFQSSVIPSSSPVPNTTCSSVTTKSTISPSLTRSGITTSTVGTSTTNIPVLCVDTTASW